MTIEVPQSHSDAPEVEGFRSLYSARKLATLILEGPDIVRPQDNPEEEILAKRLTLTQASFGRQPETWMQLYFPTTEYRPAYLLPLLRMVTYLGGDRRQLLRQQRRIPSPVMDSKYFQVLPDDLGCLDTAFRELQQAAATVRTDVEGIDLDVWYGRVGVESDYGEWAEPREGSFSGWRTADLGMHVFTYYIFGDASDVPEFDRAWRRCWDLLDGIARQERLARPLIEDWDIEPARYARFLLDIEVDPSPPVLVEGNRYGPDPVRQFGG